MKINIIYEDNSVIVLEKVRAVASQNDNTGDKSMFDYIQEHIKNKVYAVHRLDRPVGGIMVFAKTSKAASFISEQINKGEFKKEYIAVLCGKHDKKEGTLENYIIKNQRMNISRITDKGHKGAKKALLSYNILDECEDLDYGVLSLASINLKTGRHHQIRVQFMSCGTPLWGDTKYNDMFKRKAGFTYIALWSYKIGFVLPNTKEKAVFSINPPNEFPFNCFEFFNGQRFC